MAQPKLIRIVMTRGDAFSRPVNFIKQGFTWSSVTAKAKLVESDGTLVHDFAPTVTGGATTATMTLEELDTTGWATGELSMDVEVKASGLNAVTPFKILLTVKPDTST